MRRLLLAVLILVASCAGQRPVLEGESAAREVVAPFDDDAVDDGDDGGSSRLRLAVTGGWSGDPADAGPASLTDRVLADMLHDGLSQLGTDGRPEPALAERWFVSDDRLTWTFVLPDTLLDGLGSRLIARDVKRSLERVAARGPADQAATALTAVTGWDDHMRGASGGVAGISAPDLTTLVIQLDTPFELLPDVLASPAYGINGTTEDGRSRTTGPFRVSEDDDVLTAVDPESAVTEIELVRTDTDPTRLVADGLVDWAVVPPGVAADAIPADVVRQPLDLELVLVARQATRPARLGVMSGVAPLLLAGEMEGLSSKATTPASGRGMPPDRVEIDIPTGGLEPIGEAVAAQLRDAGIEVDVVISAPDDFARRVASGEAELFPAIMAGGTGGVGGMLRLATPGAVDDVFGPASADRTDLARAVAAAQDPSERAIFAAALTRSLIEEGLMRPIGVFEVRVAVSTRVDGLRHRADGTLDLSRVTLEAPVAS